MDICLYQGVDLQQNVKPLQTVVIDNLHMLFMLSLRSIVSGKMKM